MCNRYEPAQLELFERDWAEYERSRMQYERSIGPRQNGVFIKPGRIEVGQWGMIRPGAPERIQRAKPKRPGLKGDILATNNARSDRMATAATYRDAWQQGHRCLVPAVAYIYPYWGTGSNIWWRFARADGEPWMLGGLWSNWTDHNTGEVVPNYTMITQNANAHPLLRLMHQPDRDSAGNVKPSAEQDKRSVVPIERADWDQWLTGTLDDALSLLKLPALNLFAHRALDPTQQVELPIAVE